MHLEILVATLLIPCSRASLYPLSPVDAHAVALITVTYMGKLLLLFTILCFGIWLRAQV